MNGRVSSLSQLLSSGLSVDSLTFWISKQDDYEEYDSGEEESLEAELESKTGNEDETKVTIISTSYISAPTAAPSKGIPSTLLSKLAIRDEENKEDGQGKDKPGDHITADLRTNEKETDGKEKGGETDGKDFGKGKRPGSPPPRSPKRLEVELE